MTNWMTAAGIALIAGGLATLIGFRHVLWGGGERRRSRTRRAIDAPQRAAALTAAPAELVGAAQAAGAQAGGVKAGGVKGGSAGVRGARSSGAQGESALARGARSGGARTGGGARKSGAMGGGATTGGARGGGSGSPDQPAGPEGAGRSGRVARERRVAVRAQSDPQAPHVVHAPDMHVVRQSDLHVSHQSDSHVVHQSNLHVAHQSDPHVVHQSDLHVAHQPGLQVGHQPVSHRPDQLLTRESGELRSVAAEALSGGFDRGRRPGRQRQQVPSEVSEVVEDEGDPGHIEREVPPAPVQREGGLADLGLADEEPELDDEFLVEDVDDDPELRAEAEAQSAGGSARAARPPAGAEPDIEPGLGADGPELSGSSDDRPGPDFDGEAGSAGIGNGDQAEIDDSGDAGSAEDGHGREAGLSKVGRGGGAGSMGVGRGGEVVEIGRGRDMDDEDGMDSGIPVTGHGSARFEADAVPVSRLDTQPLDRRHTAGRFGEAEQAGGRFGDPRYGDRVAGWVRPHYQDEADEEVSGEYWTPVRAAGFDNDEPGYGWPVPVERLAPVPSRFDLAAERFDPAGAEAEPTAVVPQWPPARPSGRIEVPRSWGALNAKPAPEAQVNEPYRAMTDTNEPSWPLEGEDRSRRRGMLVRRTNRTDRRRGAATEFLPAVADNTQMLPSVEPEPGRPRPRPRPRPSQPDRSTVYRSRHAADPT